MDLPIVRPARAPVEVLFILLWVADMNDNSTVGDLIVVTFPTRVAAVRQQRLARAKARLVSLAGTATNKKIVATNTYLSFVATKVFFF